MNTTGTTYWNEGSLNSAATSGVGANLDHNITWANQPSAGTLQDNVSYNITGASWIYFNVTNAAITSFANTTYQRMSIMIRDNTESGVADCYMLLYSKEYTTDVTKRPQLVITYTAPPPNDTPPFYSMNSTNSTLAGQAISHNLYWQDNVNLSGYIFQFCNGTWNGTACVIYVEPIITLNENNGGNVGDIYVNEGSSNSNYGTSTNIDLQSYTNNNMRIFTLWNLAVISAGTIIVDANLTLRLLSSSGYSANKSAYNTTNSWNETGITWNNQPSIDVLQYVSSDTSITHWNVTDAVISSYNQANQNMSIVIISTTENTTAQKYWYYASKEYTTDTTKRPQLVIRYIPTIESSAWTNDTWQPMTGTGNWSNVTKKVNSTVGANIAWRVYTNDTSNNWNTSEVFTYATTDGTPPTFSNYYVDETTAGMSAKFSVVITDETTLNGYIFETNNTGNPTNTTWKALSSGGTTSDTITLNSTVGTFINIKYYANDTANNWAVYNTNLTTTKGKVYILETGINWNTIQATINNATTYQTVVINDSSEVYNENITLNKAGLKLTSNTLSFPQINGFVNITSDDSQVEKVSVNVTSGISYSAIGIMPTASNVTINNVSIFINISIGTSPYYPRDGIYVNGDNVTISFCNITTTGDTIDSPNDYYCTSRSGCNGESGIEVNSANVILNNNTLNIAGYSLYETAELILAYQYGILVTNSANNITLFSNKVNVTNGGFPFGLEGTNITADSSNLVYGVQILYNEQNNTMIENNNDLGLIWINNAYNVTVRNNNMTVQGITAYNSNNISVSNNFINIPSGYFEGVTFLDVNNSEIISNNITTNGDAGIIVREITSHLRGINLIKDNNITCNNNLCLGIRTSDVYGGVTSYTTFINNILFKNSFGYAIRTFASSMNISYNSYTNGQGFIYPEVSSFSVFDSDNIQCNNPPNNYCFYIEGADKNFTLSKLNITMNNNGGALSFSNGDYNNTLKDSNIFVNISGSDPSTITFSEFDTTSNNYNNVIYNVSILSYGASGILFQNFANWNYIINSNITSNKNSIWTKCTYSMCNYTSNFIINSTFDETKINITNFNSTIYVQWYLTANIIDSNGNPINQANVSAYDKNGNLAVSQLTDSSGNAIIPVSEFLANYTSNSTSGYYYFSNYTINVTKSDYNDNSTTVNMTASQSLNIILSSTTPLPNITVIKPLNNTIFAYNLSDVQNVKFQVNLTTPNINTSKNVTLYWRSGGTYTQNTLLCYGSVPDYICNITLDLSSYFGYGETMHYFFNTTDLSDNPGTNGTEANPLIAYVASYPTFYSNMTTTITPYSGLPSIFNITWSYPTGVTGVAIVQIDSTNYTMSQIQSNASYIDYGYSIISGVGTHYFEFYGQYIGGLWNNTANISFSITQGNPTITLTNNISWSGTFPAPSNTTCTCPSELTCNLYRNNTLVTTDNNILLGSSVYNMTCNTTGDANYTSNSTSNLLTISQSGTPSFSTSVSTPIQYGTASNYLGSESNTGDSGCVYILLRDGTNTMNGSSVSDNSVLSVGNHNYTYYTLGCTNYTFGSDYKSLIVSCNGLGYDNCIATSGCYWTGGLGGYCQAGMGTTTTTIGGGGTTTTTTTIPSFSCNNATVTQFNDSSTAKNITFTGNQNQTFYVSLPKCTFYSAQMNLSGYSIITTNTTTQDAETSYSCDGNWNGDTTTPTRCSNTVDENWATNNEPAFDTNGTVYENTTIPSNTMAVWKASLKYCHNDYGDPHSDGSTWHEIWYWDYSKNNWTVIDNNSEMSGSWCNVTLDIPMNGTLQPNLMIKTICHSTSGGGGVHCRYYEGEVIYNDTVYPTNPYLDVGNDGNKDWSYSGTFNTSQTAYFNPTDINNYLSSCSPYANGYCDVPFVLHSDTAGIIQVNGINISNSNPLSSKINYNPFTRTNCNFNDTVNISVTDYATTYQFCNISINSNTYNNVTFANNYTLINFTYNDGLNTFTVNCTDTNGNYNSNINTTTVYAKNITLIEEDTGNVFSNFTQLTKLRAIDENNQSIFNFLTNNTTSMCVLTTVTNYTLRIEKTYTDTLFIDLYLKYIPTNTRVCVANTQQFYEIIFYSKSSQPLALKNYLGNCYDLIGYTRYAYQDSLMAKAYTIRASYGLYTIGSDGIYTFLSAIDGGTAIAHNIDVIEFNKNQPSFNLLTDDFGYEMPTNTSILVWYINQKNDNIQTDIVLKNSTQVFATWNETSSPNNFTVSFDMSSFSYGLLTLNIIKHKADGTMETKETTINYMKPFTMPSELAMILASVLLFFGLTFTTKYITFGWFGILICVIAFAITTLALATPYLRLLQAVIIICCLYIGLIFKEENIKAV